MKFFAALALSATLCFTLSAKYVFAQGCDDFTIDVTTNVATVDLSLVQMNDSNDVPFEESYALTTTFVIDAQNNSRHDWSLSYPSLCPSNEAILLSPDALNSNANNGVIAGILIQDRRQRVWWARGHPDWTDQSRFDAVSCDNQQMTLTERNWRIRNNADRRTFDVSIVYRPDAEVNKSITGSSYPLGTDDEPFNGTYTALYSLSSPSTDLGNC